MAHALVLTASSSGRTSLPSDAGFALDVDGDAPVTLDVWPYPSSWIPDGVRLYRYGREVAASPTGDELRWVFTGDDRFGEFSALAIAAGRAVTSPLLVVRPAGAAAAAPVTAAGASTATAVQPSQPAGGPSRDRLAPFPLTRSQAPGQPPHEAPDDFLIDLSARHGAQMPPAPAAPARATPVSGSASPGPASAADLDTQALPTPASPERETAVTARSAAPSAPAEASPPPPPPAAPAPSSAQSAASSLPTTTAGRIPAHASPTDLRALAEVPAGEFDGRFAAWVGILFAMLAGGFAALVVTRLLIDIDVPAPAPTGAEAPISHEGTVAERVGLATSTVLIALGGVLLLAGAALAALEVRGRQRRAPAAPSAWRAQESGLRIIPAMIERLNQIPAVIAVLVVGGIVLGLGLIGTLYWPTLF